MPHLAIVDRTIFGLASARKADRSQSSGPVAARPKHFLSGLTKCGCCGASYTVMGNDRIGCAGFRERGDCDNNRTIARSHVEQRVLEALDHYLADPEAIAEYVAEYHRVRRELAETKSSQRDSLTNRLADLDRQIESLVDLVVAGRVTDALLDRLRGLETEREALRAQALNLAIDDEPVVLHPSAAQRYRQIIAELRTHLDGIREGQPRDIIFESLRSMIEKVVITPTGARQPVDIQVHGLLAELLIQKKEAPQLRGALVAGAGFEPATFRL
ncbi:MAG: zinc ribbon domain-containing protein [Devosia sp.]|nr:MAG: zinc ribbon domain-containing protein [Devosia sp.]